MTNAGLGWGWVVGGLGMRVGRKDDWGAGFCVSILLKKNPELINQLNKRKGLFWLTVAEVSISGLLSLCLW